MHTNTNVQETQPSIGVCYNDIYDNVIISYSSHSLVICHLFLTHNFDYQPEYTLLQKYVIFGQWELWVLVAIHKDKLMYWVVFTSTDDDFIFCDCDLERKLAYSLS